MARYPTFEEYQKRGNYSEGIRRCDELLAKSPDDVQLLTVKLQLTYASNNDPEPILNQLVAIQPPISNVRDLLPIEEAIVKSLEDVFPQPQTAGTTMAKLWDGAVKASVSINVKLDIISLRFSRAIEENRLVDAQQALIQLKAAQPKNRSFYMAHAILTQMISKSKDDLQARLALSLARKAVVEKFDEDAELDCRVPGQVFALQESRSDLDSIAGRSFKGSKQVYDALRKIEAANVNGGHASSTAKSKSSTSPAEKLFQDVQRLKEEFSRLIESSANIEAVSTFAASSIRSFHTATASTSDGRGRGLTDSCFVSISALVRTFELSNDTKYLLYASFLAEQLLQQNTQVHEARLILVYLYMRLNLGSLALQMFDSLSIKEIQHDTVGHCLFTRLSYTHPFNLTGTKKKEATDPIKRTSNALAVYTRCEEKLAETEMNVLNSGQTGMLLDLQELRDTLRLSLSRRITLLEQRRLWRLEQGTHSGEPVDLGPRVTANWVETVDSREFAATFDFGYNVEKVLHGINGAVPGKEWVLCGLAADVAWCLAMGFPTPVKDVETLLKELADISVDLDRLKIDGGTASVPGMSVAEVLAGDFACRVIELLQHSSESGSDDSSSHVEAVLIAVERLNVDVLLQTTVLHAERLRDHFVFLDILRIVVKVCDMASGQSNAAEERLQKLQKISRDYFAAIQARARDHIKAVQIEPIKALLDGGDSLSDAIKLFNDRNIDIFCNSIASSAKEGWETLTRVKLV